MPDGSITFVTALDNKTLEKELASVRKKLQTLSDNKAVNNSTLSRMEGETKRLAAALDKARTKLEAMSQAQSGMDGKKKQAAALQKELASVQKKLQTLSDNKAVKNSTMAQMESESRQLAAVLDEAKAKLESMNQAQKTWMSTTDIDEQKTRVAAMQKEWDRSANAIERMQIGVSETDKRAVLLASRAAAIKKQMEAVNIDSQGSTSSDIDRQKQQVAALQKEWQRSASATERMQRSIQESSEHAEILTARAAAISRQISSSTQGVRTAQKRLGGLKARLDTISAATAKIRSHVGGIAPAAKRADGALAKIGKRLKHMVTQALIFTTLYSAFRSTKNWFGDIIKSNNEAAAAMARLKGASLTAVQPIVDIVIPAFTSFVNLLARGVASIAQFTSSLAGKTVKESASAAKALYEQQKAYKAIGKSAKDAERNLASFDEINKLHSNKSGDEATDEPDFNYMDIETLDLAAWDKFKAFLQPIAGLLLAIAGAALEVWTATAGLRGWMKDALLDFIGWLTEKLIAFTEWAKENPQAVEHMATIIIGFLAGLWVYNSVIKLIDFIVVLTASLGKMGIAIFGVGWKAGLAAIAFGILAAGILILAANWNKMSGFQRAATILGAVAAAAVAAAIAMGAFHATWSVGLAAAAIAGGIALIVGVMASVKKSVSEPISMPEVQGVPGLATGAVLEPNKPFLAMVGDQKNGTNIEAPLATIEEAVGNVISRNKNSALSGESLSALSRIESSVSVIADTSASLQRIEQMTSKQQPIIAELLRSTMSIREAVTRLSTGTSSLISAVATINSAISFPTVSANRLVSGAVTPPNSTFMTAMGNQKRSENTEATLENMVAAIAALKDEMLAELQRIASLLEKKQSVVLDTGTLVGEVTREQRRTARAMGR